MEAFGASDRGLWRSRNEDRYLARSLGDGSMVLAVSDGMGGEPAGDVAAQAVVDALAGLACGHDLPKERIHVLAQAVDSAERDIHRMVASAPRLAGMGATVTAVLARPERAVYIHAGDSRLYLCRGGVLTRITTDHTASQDLVDQGLLTQEEADAHPMGNVLLRCVGCGGKGPGTGSLDLRQGDVLLLCTDGLHKQLQEADIEAALASGRSPRETALLLVDLALKAGGRDNVTVVVLRV